eukprot:CAMPEP_0175623272 /NCGR_PEP_ID=MMETSP0096-20121207/69349_1 /TAXON_ID=311494 /ORGANISM="Alexandrium monilatum, Strain CCMP3105" /LENGTH=38 /DNA_ID= /DNA_START= /DNA_END= /DNA_ORIENTATION=
MAHAMMTKGLTCPRFVKPLRPSGGSGTPPILSSAGRLS